MATLTGEQLKDSYQSLVTIGDSITTDPTSGVLENGKGSPIDSVTVYNDATGVSDSSILNLSVLADDSNTNPRVRLEASKAGTNGGKLILSTLGGDVLTERMRIHSTGDISFRDGATNEAFYWDASAGSLGIGTDSPSAPLTVQGGSASSASIQLNGGNANDNSSIQSLYGLILKADSSESIAGRFIDFEVGTTSAMRIDSSGNVLIGTTNNSPVGNNVSGGIGLFPNGSAQLSRDGGTALLLNRKTSDGTIADFRKDGTTVGSIGTLSSHVYIGKGDTGLRFVDSLECIEPFDTSTPTIRDAGIDLGRSASRFKDLYLGGSVYLGGTTSANALDDYEEGTWSPVYAPSSGSFTTMTMDVISATYTKVGRQVTVRAYFRTDEVVLGTASGDLLVSGLPFTSGTLESSAGNVGYVNDWGTAPDGCVVNANSTQIRLRKTNVTADVQPSDLTTGANPNDNEIILTATYFV